MSQEIKDTFDKILTLQLGDRIFMPCHDKKQCHSTRVQMGKERNQFLQKFNPDFDIAISTEEINSKWVVILQKAERFQPVIVSKSGKAEPLIFSRIQDKGTVQDGVPEVVVTKQSDRERMEALMRQDGMSDGEIEAYFGEDKPEDLSQ